MSVTISDIARLANVSKAAVSAAINDKPGISKATREKILEIMKRVNYKPSQVARSLSNRKTRTIGLIIKEIDNPYFSKITKGVFDTCQAHDYNVILGSSELNPSLEEKSIDALYTQRVDGLILSPLQDENTNFYHLSQLIQKGYPLVTLGIVPNFQTHVVEIDNEKAILRVIEYLTQSGHQKITFLAGPSHSRHSHERLQAYKRGMEKFNLQNHTNVIQAGSSIEEGHLTGLYHQSIKDFSAIICYNDLVAIGLINALFERNISVPKDISVVGFDDIAFGAYFRVPLTTVGVPAYEIGKKAATMLIHQIESEEPVKKEHIILDTKLIIRNSVTKHKQ